MAINKTINKSTKTHGAMRNCIEYVLNEKKTEDGLIYMTGPAPDVLNWDSVYRSFLEEKRIWNKDSGRMYNHNVISFAPEENITPEEAFDFGIEFAEKWFSKYQTLVSVHQDKDHIHIHLLTNTVSYVDGMKIHTSRIDLQHMKDFTNKMCIARGLRVAEKGRHFDGTQIKPGDKTIAWSKDKYNLIENENKKSYVVDCALAVMEAREISCSREDFVRAMKDKGWKTTWTDSRKYITFENENGKKVRNSNLSKTFSIDVSKEALLNEFKRQNEIRIERARIAREPDSEREREEELRKYYAEVEAAVSGADRASVTDNTEAEDRTGREGYTDTEALVWEVRDVIRNSRTENRAVINAELKSVASAEQRQAEERQRADAARRAREIEIATQMYYEPSR